MGGQLGLYRGDDLPAVAVPSLAGHDREVQDLGRLRLAPAYDRRPDRLLVDERRIGLAGGSTHRGPDALVVLLGVVQDRHQLRRLGSRHRDTAH
nr:hypothetical protein [Frankia tisae]